MSRRARSASRQLPTELCRSTSPAIPRRVLIGTAAGAVLTSACVQHGLLRLQLNRKGEVVVPYSRLRSLDARAALTVRAGGQDVVIRRHGADYIAVWPLCTHRSCGLSVVPEGYECRCHGSSFTAAGEVRRGPATAALERVPTTPTANGLRLLLTPAGPAEAPADA